MNKLIISLMMAISSISIAAPHKTFKTFYCKPTSNFCQSAFDHSCLQEARIILYKDGRSDFYGKVRRPGLKISTYFVLLGHEDKKGSTPNFYKFKLNKPTSYFYSTWDDNEHWMELYSNNRRQWGGRLALEEDAGWRIRCVLR